MARKEALPQADLDRSRQVKLLRLELRMSRSEFAQLVGLGVYILTEKEFGRVPFKNAEIAQIKARVNAHLATCVQTLSSLEV